MRFPAQKRKQRLSCHKLVGFACTQVMLHAIYWRSDVNHEEEVSMRLQRKEDRVVAQFSFPGEIATLATKEGCWLPLYLPGHLEHPIGAIHSTTYEVRLRSDLVVVDRQVVVLGPTPTDDVPN
jgi:hypothetical protein